MLDPRSEPFLAGVHPDLVAVVRLAAETVSFRVTEGLRSLERQRQMVRGGHSKTMHSRHLTGHAVDVVDVHGTYAEIVMREIATAMKAAAVALGRPVEWGGDWHGFQDTPHFQLPFASYPDGDHVAHGPVIDAVATPVSEPVAAGSTSAAPVAGLERSAASDQMPGWDGVKAAIAGSRTILGTLLALLGLLVQAFDWVVRLVLDAAGELANLGPALAYFEVKTAGWVLAVFGVALAGLRRLQAAYKGKVG